MPANDGAEGEAADVDPIMAAYAAKLKQADADDLDTDDEYNPLEIRTKVQAFQAEHGEKLSSELMSEAFRWRLSQTDCQNRGYVLDGYPKSYKTAQEVFVVTPIKPEKAKKQVGEGEDEEEEEKIPEPEEEEEEENKKKYAPQF
jgi:adenylate kinase family enzyme